MLEAFFRNPGQLGIALALLGLAGGGFLSWLFTFYYFKKSQSQRLLCYTTRDSDYLGYSSDEFQNLSVLFRGKKLANPVRYTVYAWNCGNVTLDHADISNIDPLAFGANEIEILEVAPLWSTRDSINPKHTIDAAKSKIYVEFDFLDPGDGFALQFLADRPTPRRRTARIEAYGTIKGLSRAPFKVSAGFNTSSWWGPYVALAVALFFAFSTAAISYDAWLSGMEFTTLIKVLAAIIFGFITLAIVGLSFQTLTERSFTIPALLRKSNETSFDADDKEADLVLRDHRIRQSLIERP